MLKRYRPAGLWWCLLPAVGTLLPRGTFFALIQTLTLLATVWFVAKRLGSIQLATRSQELREITGIIGGQIATVGTVLYFAALGLTRAFTLTLTGKAFGALVTAGLAGIALAQSMDFAWLIDHMPEFHASGNHDSTLYHP